MNIHHLELFYHVARHGGISRAVRHMPYGVQQPAVSSQILALEQSLGAKLFERTPFQLTATGKELYAFVRPFFENLDTFVAKLRQNSGSSLRIGAVEMVVRDHLHSVIKHLRGQHSRLQLSLQSGFTPQVLSWLEEREIDFAAVPLLGKPPPRIRSMRLMRMPLVLQVPRSSKLKSAESLWSRKTIDEPLITLPASETISRVFRKGLQRRRVTWAPAIEASSLLAVTRYVADGHGMGVNVDAEVARDPKVRVLPLRDFDELEVVLLWHGEPTPLIRATLESSMRYVKRKWPKFYCGA